MLQKLSSVFAVGFPGLNRLLLFGLISSFATRQELGQFANDFAVAQLLSFLTSVGWGVLLLVRSAQNSEDTGSTEASNISIYPTALLLVSIPLIAVLWHMGVVFSPFWTWVYLAGWSGFNLFRAKCIGANNHPPLLIVEGFILSGTVSLLLFSWGAGPAMMLGAIPFALTGMVWLIGNNVLRLKGGRRADGSFVDRQTVRRGLEYGVANLTSAALFSQLPILFAQTGSVSQAGLIGTLLSVVAVMDLVPASITTYFLPQTARYVKGGNYASYTDLLARQQKVLLAGLLGMAAMAISGWMILYYARHPLVEMAGATQSFALLLTCSFVNHLSSPAANYLQAHEKSGVSVRINLVTFMAFWVLYFVLPRHPPVLNGAQSLIALLIPIAIRTSVMRRILSKALLAHRNSKAP